MLGQRRRRYDVQFSVTVIAVVRPYIVLCTWNWHRDGDSYNVIRAPATEDHFDN